MYHVSRLPNGDIRIEMTNVVAENLMHALAVAEQVVRSDRKPVLRTLREMIAFARR